MRTQACIPCPSASLSCTALSSDLELFLIYPSVNEIKIGSRNPCKRLLWWFTLVIFNLVSHPYCPPLPSPPCHLPCSLIPFWTIFSDLPTHKFIFLLYQLCFQFLCKSGPWVCSLVEKCQVCVYLRETRAGRGGESSMFKIMLTGHGWS